MSECLTFYSNPDDSSACAYSPPDESSVCKDCCNCGYIQYEGLFSYLQEIKSGLNHDPEKSVEFEFRLREQIIEISRLFDMEAGVDPGHFSKAHFSTTEMFPTHGTKFIKIPGFVKGTLSVRTTGDSLLADGSYDFKDGFLVYLPCQEHSNFGCDTGCSLNKSTQPLPWPNMCYKVTARWGKECADYAVQMAIRDYLIESYRVKDPVMVAATGLPISRNFQIPHSWSAYLRNFKAKRGLYSQFAFA